MQLQWLHTPIITKFNIQPVIASLVPYFVLIRDQAKLSREMQDCLSRGAVTGCTPAAQISRTGNPLPILNCLNYCPSSIIRTQSQGNCNTGQIATYISLITALRLLSFSSRMG